MEIALTTFQQVYCQQHRIPEDQFATHLRPRVLYSHARLLAPLVGLYMRGYVVADSAFIDGGSRLTRYH